MRILLKVPSNDLKHVDLLALNGYVFVATSIKYAIVENTQMLEVIFISEDLLHHHNIHLMKSTWQSITCEKHAEFLEVSEASQMQRSYAGVEKNKAQTIRDYIVSYILETFSSI